MLKKPQIVAPGGSFEKAIVAFNYGADSVYIAGAQFGLRKSADNFSYDQMQELCEFAHKKEKNACNTCIGLHTPLRSTKI